MNIGVKGKMEALVEEANSAIAVGSGTLKVFATPAMVALVEETAWKSVVPYLEKGQTTVGTNVNVSHVAPTPLGMKVYCETELIEAEGRKLKFKVCVHDEKGLIGEGTHERFIVDADRFQAKANSK